VILELERVCWGEGIGPAGADREELLNAIAANIPNLLSTTGILTGLINGRRKETTMNKTGEIRCINGFGDVRTPWDKDDPVSLAEAEKVFNDLRSKEKRLAAVKNEDGTHTMIKAFDPGAKEIKMFRPLIGGSA
jgi:hypothetical protein